MQIKELRDYVALGVVSGFKAERVVMGKGWYLVVTGRQGQVWTLETALRQQRVFASLDTMLSTVEQVGGKVEAVTFA